jgi:serine/threonine-protein kinase
MQLVPEVPPALDTIVLRALEKDPARRFADADEFIAALEAARAAPQEVIAPPPVVEEVVEEDEGRRWWLWLLILLALAAIALGMYLLLRPEQLTVPDVIGRESATATQILQNRGFEVDIVNVENPDVERNTVAAQAPRPNTQAPEGSTVTITVSTGPGEATVPTVAGLPTEEAEGQIESAGLRARIERQFSDDVERGRVIGTEPGPGSVVERGTTVVLQVSRGVEQVDVPDVVGDGVDDARIALADAGLRAGNVTEQDNAGEEPGTVLEQSPAAGEQVASGSAVDLVVATEPPGVEVPDLLDLDEDEARDELEAAGFQVRVRDQTVTDQAQDGVVLDQAPDPGEEQPEGSTVRISVGRFEEATATPTPSPTAEP